jgi:hypothetical protein
MKMDCSVGLSRSNASNIFPNAVMSNSMLTFK